MNIGLIVDGQAEFRSLYGLLRRIESPYTLLSPIYADIQPLAPLPQILGAIKRKIPILKSKNASRVLILLDRENREICPGHWAQVIEERLNACCPQCGLTAFDVVIKETRFENWLVSDPALFKHYPKRYKTSNGIVNSVQPNKADNLDAVRFLNTITLDGSYDKVEDAVKILRVADPVRMASNSRSFRRFLRKIGYPTYINQSLRPVT